MDESNSDDIAAGLTLEPGEVITLRGLHILMMRNDRAAESREKKAQAKSEQIDIFASATTKLLADLPDASAVWFAQFDSVPDDSQVAADRLVELAPTAAERIADRSRAVVMLIELVTFSPWIDGQVWVPKAREDAIAGCSAHLRALGTDDVATVTKEFEALMKQLRRKSIRWGRIAAVSVVGLGVGVATAGWAAAPIGAAIGSTLGLSGAAATSAGLAALGGGSLAAGGLGVAGGTLLVTGVGGVAGAGAAAAGIGFSRLGNTAIMIEAIKLDLLSRVLLADATDADQRRRRVVESLQQRINEQAARVNLLAERIVKLKGEKAELTEANIALRAELKAVRAEHDSAQQAQSTLEVVLDRVSAGVADD